jgi:hypothetical protein
MVPIHDTDVAEERWSKAEWENYELWEKVELRLKRHKRLWILATGLLFVTLSAVPIMLERWPKWTTRSMAVLLGREVNRIKREAINDRSAYRIRFNQDAGLSYSIEKVPNCSETTGQVTRTGSLQPKDSENAYAWFDPAVAKEMGIPGLVKEFCYDYLAGSGSVLKGESVVGFGIIPVKDLAEKKLDRMSLLLLSGPSAEISFD